MKLFFKTFLKQPTVLRVLMSPGSLFHNVGVIREKKDMSPNLVLVFTSSSKRYLCIG